MNASKQNLPKDPDGMVARQQYDKLVHMYYDHFPSGSIFFFNDCYLIKRNYKGLRVEQYQPMDDGSGKMNVVVKL